MRTTLTFVKEGDSYYEITSGIRLCADGLRRVLCVVDLPLTIKISIAKKNPKQKGWLRMEYNADTESVNRKGLSFNLFYSVMCFLNEWLGSQKDFWIKLES